MADGFDKFMNFLMPPLVFLFIGFIFYRIPLVKQGVDALIEKIKGWREKRDEGGFEETSIYKTIQYE